MKKKRPMRAAAVKTEQLTQNVILSHHLLVDSLREIKYTLNELRRDLSAFRTEWQEAGKPRRTKPE